MSSAEVALGGENITPTEPFTGSVGYRLCARDKKDFFRFLVHTYI